MTVVVVRALLMWLVPEALDRFCVWSGGFEITRYVMIIVGSFVLVGGAQVADMYVSFPGFESAAQDVALRNVILIVATSVMLASATYMFTAHASVALVMSSLNIKGPEIARRASNWIGRAEINPRRPHIAHPSSHSPHISFPAHLPFDAISMPSSDACGDKRMPGTRVKQLMAKQHRIHSPLQEMDGLDGDDLKTSGSSGTGPSGQLHLPHPLPFPLLGIPPAGGLPTLDAISKLIKD
eukprot:3439690-Pyramimonas_sp.AAC.1